MRAKPRSGRFRRSERRRTRTQAVRAVRTRLIAPHPALEAIPPIRARRPVTAKPPTRAVLFCRPIALAAPFRHGPNRGIAPCDSVTRVVARRAGANRAWSRSTGTSHHPCRCCSIMARSSVGAAGRGAIGRFAGLGFRSDEHGRKWTTNQLPRGAPRRRFSLPT
jgi:hypothetical protein